MSGAVSFSTVCNNLTGPLNSLDTLVYCCRAEFDLGRDPHLRRKVFTVVIQHCTTYFSSHILSITNWLKDYLSGKASLMPAALCEVGPQIWG